MKYPLEDLLRVRRLREDAAARALSKQRLALEAAEKALHDWQRRLAEYVETRKRKTEELYREVMGLPTQKPRLDDLRMDLSVLAAKQSEMEDAVLTAEKNVDAEREKLRDAVRAYFLAASQREKLDRHKDDFRTEANRAAEKRAELELEDFRVRSLTGEAAHV